MKFNLINPLSFFYGKDMIRHVGNLSTVALITAVLILTGVHWVPLQMILWVSLIVLASITIWRAGDFFAPAAEYIQKQKNLPESIKAAVIDAIASSFPEFCVALIAVLFIGRAEIGISSIVGSALYNVLIIPAASGLVATSAMVISKEVVWRDSLFYFGVVGLLIAILMIYPTEWGLTVGLLLLTAYLGYIAWLQWDYKQHLNENVERSSVEEEQQEEKEERELTLTSEKRAWYWILGMMFVMGGASHVLVEGSIELGEILGIDAVIMGFIVIAAGTSVPDTVLSVLSAKRGNYDAALSNVFGSNIFDICICLSFPILLALLMTGTSTPVILQHTELVWLLLISTVIAIYMFWSNQYTLTKAKCTLMIGLYLFIALYAITL